MARGNEGVSPAVFVLQSGIYVVFLFVVFRMKFHSVCLINHVKNKKMQKTVTVPFMLLGVLFNVCLIASNLLETKVIQVGGVTATAGLIVFPVSYIINDCIAEVWGFKKARLIIWSGFAMNFLVVAFAQLAIMLPAAPLLGGGSRV